LIAYKYLYYRLRAALIYFVACFYQTSSDYAQYTTASVIGNEILEIFICFRTGFLTKSAEFDVKKYTGLDKQLGMTQNSVIFIKLVKLVG